MKIFGSVKKFGSKKQSNLYDNKFLINKIDIKKWLDKYKIENYTINDDLSVDVYGGVNLCDKNLKFIPVKFGKVTGDFWCQGNNLINLDGSPKIVTGDFLCDDNKLTSLIGAPKVMNGYFSCVNNPLTSLFEIIDCNFKENIYFNIDEKNFKQKEMIQVLKRYYSEVTTVYVLTKNEMNDAIKPILEKEILKQKLNNSKTKTKISFI